MWRLKARRPNSILTSVTLHFQEGLAAVPGSGGCHTQEDHGEGGAPPGPEPQLQGLPVPSMPRGVTVRAGCPGVPGFSASRKQQEPLGDTRPPGFRPSLRWPANISLMHTPRHGAAVLPPGQRVVPIRSVTLWRGKAMCSLPNQRPEGSYVTIVSGKRISFLSANVSDPRA